MLAAFAKEEGKSLHRDLPSEERRSAIEQKVSRLSEQSNDFNMENLD